MPRKSSATSRRLPREREALLRGEPPTTPFARTVYRVVSMIPRGETRTYGQVAAMADRPGAARAVGTIMSRNTDTKKVPCHRVVRADGKVGDYAFGGPKKKLALLKREGAM